MIFGSLPSNEFIPGLTGDIQAGGIDGQMTQQASDSWLMPDRHSMKEVLQECQCVLKVAHRQQRACVVGWRAHAVHDVVLVQEDLCQVFSCQERLTRCNLDLRCPLGSSMCHGGAAAKAAKDRF